MGFDAPVTLVTSADEPGTWSGTGQVVRQLGTFTATVRCDADHKFHRPDARSAALGALPAGGPPGGEIYTQTDMFTCKGGVESLSSPGFARLLESWGGNYGRINSRWQAVTVPGTYVATLRCRSPEVGTMSFTVLGMLPERSPRPRLTAPRAPIVKPRGAPQTGGG